MPDDRINLPLNQLAAEVAGKVFAGCEYNGQRKVRPLLNTANKPNIDLSPIKGLAVKDKQSLNAKNLVAKEGSIIEALKKYPNSLLFWAHAHIKSIFDEIKKPNPNMKYWKKHFNDWVERHRRQNKCKNDLMGETTSYTVAEINKLITINMITDGLDGMGSVLWEKMSEIFAKGAKGAVFFLTDAENESDLEDKTWGKIERPTLMKNKDVDIIVELDLKNPEKVNSIIVKGNAKNGFDILKEYGFELPNINNVKRQEMFSGNFKLKFKDDQIYCVEIDKNGAEKSGIEKTLDVLAKENKKQQQNAKVKIKYRLEF